MKTRSSMSWILGIQAVIALAGAAIAEILGYLAFSHPYARVNLSYYRVANMAVAVIGLAVSAYYFYIKLYPVIQVLASESESRFHREDMSAYKKSIMNVPNTIAVCIALIAIDVAIIMGVSHAVVVGEALRSIKMGLSLGASWSLMSLLNYHLLRVQLMPVAQRIVRHGYAEELGTVDRPVIFRRLVIGGLVICAVSGILVTIVLHGCMEARMDLGPGIARVVMAFLLTQAATVVTLYYLGVSVAKPLSRLMKLTAKVGAGDLSAKFAEVTGDEMELVGRSFNIMVDSLRKMTLQLKEVMEEVSVVSADLMEIAEQQTHRGEERAVAVTQISASIEHVSKTAQQVAEHCESMAKSAEHALERAMEGQKLVSDTAEGIERVRDTVAAMSKHILSLGEKSKQIGDIIETISGIADETHLLALNAAIESAGAGEHGRRFGVVASEVKRLAQRAVAETAGIKKILTEIQTAANASVLATEQGIKEVETGTSLARGAREAIDRVMALVDDTAKRTREISDATERQKQANLQIVSSMREITAASREAAVANKQSRASARSLMDLGERLSIIIRLFNVDGSPEATGEDEESQESTSEKN